MLLSNIQIKDFVTGESVDTFEYFQKNNKVKLIKNFLQTNNSQLQVLMNKYSLIKIIDENFENYLNIILQQNQIFKGDYY